MKPHSRTFSIETKAMKIGQWKNRFRVLKVTDRSGTEIDLSTHLFCPESGLAIDFQGHCEYCGMVLWYAIMEQSSTCQGNYVGKPNGKV